MYQTFVERLAAAKRGELSKQEGNDLFATDASLVRRALLATLEVIRSQQAHRENSVTDGDALEEAAGADGQAPPSTPSGAAPVHAKSQSRRSGKKPGAKRCHPGSRRPRRERVDRYTNHQSLAECPGCNALLPSPRRSRKRIAEDLPSERVSAEVTEHHLPEHWCSSCRQWVTPVVADAVPRADLGHRIVAFTAWLRYGLGVPISHAMAILRYPLQTKPPEDGWWRCGSDWPPCSATGMSKSPRKRGNRATFMRMRPDGGSTAKPSGSGRSRARWSATT